MENLNPWHFIFGAYGLVAFVFAAYGFRLHQKTRATRRHLKI